MEDPGFLVNGDDMVVEIEDDGFDAEEDPGFIANDDDMVGEFEDNGLDAEEDGFDAEEDGFDAEEDGFDAFDAEEDVFDSVCSICDNGGELLRCEGSCMRFFHATVEACTESMCESLGLSAEQVEAIENFVCKNCQCKQHQCFVCGMLGSSDKSSGAEVFSCVSATCGRFYHPRCVAMLLHRENAVEAEELQKKIADGESFTCPIHKCFFCKQVEDTTDRDLQFAVCRRCPKSFHRRCLPRKIGFEDDEANGITKRAWEGLMPKNRVMIYCLKHEIEEEMETPLRNHIKFPQEQLLQDASVPSNGVTLPQEDASVPLSNGFTLSEEDASVPSNGVTLPPVEMEDEPVEQ